MAPFAALGDAASEAEAAQGVIRYAAKALIDVNRLHRRLLQASTTAAAKFLDLLADAETQIARAPASWPAPNGAARRYLISFGRSVYVIQYVEDGSDQIILRIWHGREDRA